MKKILISTILGLTVAVASVHAQSSIQLYATTLPACTINGVGVGAGYTMGVYYALGDVTASVNAITGGATTSGGQNVGTLTGSGLTLGTGVGSTVSMEGNGEYYSIPSHVVSVAPPTGSPLITVVLVAYNGASYESSTIRGHSAAFTMTAVSSPGFALNTGDAASTFAVVIPEPSTFALAGLGLASLLIFRRRK